MGSSPSNAQVNQDAAARRQRRLRRVARSTTVAAALVGMISPIMHADVAGAATATTKRSATAKAVKSPLPVMNVTDVKTGKQVALASTFDGTKPMLVWFWAPH